MSKKIFIIFLCINFSFLYAAEKSTFKIVQKEIYEEYKNESLLDSSCKITSIKLKDKKSKLEMEFQNISFSNKKFKILEDKVNKTINNIISNEQKYITENITYEEDSLYLESFISMSFYKNYICAFINVTYWNGAHPAWDMFTFTLDTDKNTLVNLCDITKLSKQSLFKKIVEEYNKIAEEGVSYDFDPEEYTYDENAVLRIPYTFTEDEKILLVFIHSSLWKEPGPDIYLDIK